MYSDLSFILLGQIAERVIGGPLDDYVKLNLERLEIYNTSYLPKNEIFFKIAPT